MGPFTAVHTALLWGGLAIASPILIHLLSKRRFIRLDWAAMDFLLQADRRNRRRIRLEHLLLLLLRCLTVLLIALLVARPVFDPSGLGASHLHLGSCEHVVLLDDSPSMGLRQGHATLFEKTQASLVTFVRDLAHERPQDRLTLFVTSDLKHPRIHAAHLGPDALEALLARIRRLGLSDYAARMDEALLALSRHIEDTRDETNHAIYLVSDFRARDWQPAAVKKEAGTPLAMLKRTITEHADAIWYGIDVSRGAADNLCVREVRPPRSALVQGVPARFEAVVENFGTRDVDDVEVVFRAGGVIPLRGRVPTIAPGRQATVPFTFTFQDQGAVPVEVEIDAKDDLPVDNVRRFAAQVTEGVRVLVVDGEPSIHATESEAFYVHRALAPPGRIRAGYAVEVVTENQFSALALASHELILLCNLFRLEADRVEALRTWVKRGGGLVYFLGDQVDAQAYANIQAQAPELMPVRLKEIRGDPDERTWVHLAPELKQHPVLRVFAGERNPLLEQVKIFRWWALEMDKKTAAAVRPAVVARFTDAENTPAIVESRAGEGRVLVVATAADSEWSTWVSNPSFVVTMQELARHMVRPASGHRQQTVGARLLETIDPAQHALEVRLVPPQEGEPMLLRATAIEDEEGMAVAVEDTRRAGFYRLERRRRDGKPDPVLFAVNVASDEGNLQSLKAGTLEELAAATGMRYAKDLMARNDADVGNKVELWRGILLALIAVLFLEQGLAWFFGWRRQVKV